MKIKISKRTIRIIIAYLSVLAILYIIIFVIPSVTDAFDKTQVLENGTLEVSCDTQGYLVKEEAVCRATDTGTIAYNLSEGTVVKKGSEICSITPKESKDEKPQIRNKYREYLKRLKNYDLLQASNEAPISGVFSTSIDGFEKYFSISNIDNIKKDGAEAKNTSQLDLNREDVIKGEPVFKISNDDYWYVVCWLDKADAKKFEQDSNVKLTLSQSTLDAKVYSVKKEGEFYKLEFFLNSYYEEFCSIRKLPISIVQSNTTGLIVNNECIISKDGQKGVYVKTKDDDTYFVPIKVKITDGEQSVIYESIYINDEYEQVETVSVYQEVLKNPKEALENDMKNDTEEEQ